MELWNRLSLIICMALYAKGLQSRQPSGYIGCYEKGTFGENITTSVTRLNTGPYCISVCRALAYNYAGTQDLQCKCGHNIRSDSKRTDCTYKCAGQRNEFCGGLKSISVYYTSRRTTHKTAPNTSLILSTDAIDKFAKEIIRDKTIEDEHGLFNNLDCVKSADDMDMVDGDRGKFTFHANNTSTSCKMYCLSLRYRFAGTKLILCICAESITNDIETGICDFECPGDEKEICGGVYAISLYNTGFENTETTEQEVTTTTTTTTTTKENTEIVTPIQSRTELSSTKNQIKTESQITVTTEAAQGSSSERVSPEKDIVWCFPAEVYLSIQAGIVVTVSVVAGAILSIWRNRRVQHDTDAKYKFNENSQSNPRSRTVENDDDYLNYNLQGNLPSSAAPNNDNGHLSELLQSNRQSPNVAKADNESLQSIRVVSAAVHEYVDMNYDELVSQRPDDNCYSQLAT